MNCPKCNTKGFRRKGFHFDHEYRCPACDHVWEPTAVTEAISKMTTDHVKQPEDKCSICSQKTNLMFYIQQLFGLHYQYLNQNTL